MLTANDSASTPPSSTPLPSSATLPASQQPVQDNPPQAQSQPPSSSRTTFTIGTRRSALAMWQANSVQAQLATLNRHQSYSFEIEAMATNLGDTDKTTALYAMNAKSLWTHELEVSLLAGGLDVLVHCLKDMPTQLPANCALAAACMRAERRDCVIMSAANHALGHRELGDLPPGSVVGTSSVRRIAQVRRHFPQLECRDVRGNIDTRLRKLDAAGGGYAALILAAAGVQRIGLGGRISLLLDRQRHGWMGPVGQGALAFECRTDDALVREMCEAVMDDESRGGPRTTWLECLAERMLLRTLEGGCSVPIGVDTVWTGDELVLYGMVLSVDGKKVVEGKRSATVRTREEAEALGLEVAAALVEMGAGEILEAITLNRKIINESGGA